MKGILQKTCLFTFLTHQVLASDAVTPKMRSDAEKVITVCEKSYQETKNQRTRLDNVKKAGVFASKAKKDLYKNKALNLKAFDRQFSEFTKFTNEKIGIRTAKTQNKLRDAIAAYSSNCSRFSKGLSNFVEWVMTGKSPEPGFEIIFQDWQEEAKNN